MLSFLKPPLDKPAIAADKVDSTYTKLRWQVFFGIFIGYAGYYLVRKNFSLVMPDLIAMGYTKTELGFALSGVSIAYGLSKFVMGLVSDRSNARVFLSIGLFLSGLTMIFMGTVAWATSSIAIMFGLLLLNGWFQGMGWPPAGRVMVYWFSQKERGRKMSLWNVAHNVGGGLVGPMATLAMLLFGSWQSKFYFPGMVAIAVAFVAYVFIKDTPQSCGLPSIESYKKDFKNPYQNLVDVKESTKDIFLKYIIHNKLLWYISFANAFVYLVRYGVLDWSPTYLSEVKGYSIAESGWAYFAYEYAGIPGTLLCGWLSDKIFNGKRALSTILYLLFVLLAVLIYWKNPPGNPLVDQIALVTIGFFIYGPVMLIGVFALDLVPKNAAGTAAGFTGIFGYIGGALFANIALGYVVDHYGWSGGFIILALACVIAIVFTIPIWLHERKY
ncbi:MAG: sn-glycerol-3-phosphate transporter [Bacteroidota bacterium]